MTRKKTGSRGTNESTPVLLESLESAAKQLRDRISAGEELLRTSIENREQLELAKNSFHTWNEYNTTLLRTMFSSDELSRSYSHWGVAFIGPPRPVSDQISELRKDIQDKLRRLESIVQRLPLYAKKTTGVSRGTSEEASASKSRRVFIVHGRDEGTREAVARFLAQLDLIPIILHETASAGLTIIEKVESNAEACFAVILLTPDDAGRLVLVPEAESLPRARQNVIFEWGYFVGKLGRRNVCALRADGVELPSDMHGIVYVDLDASGAWKMLLVRELKAAGIDVDANRAM